MKPSERSQFHRYARAFLISGDFGIVWQGVYAVYRKLSWR